MSLLIVPLSYPDCISVTDFETSRMAADPVLDPEPGNALEFAFIVGNEREPSGFGVSSNPEIIAAYPFTVRLQRRTDLAVDCRRFPWQGSTGKEI